MANQYPHFESVTKDGDSIIISIRTSKTSSSFMRVSTEIAKEILENLNKVIDSMS